MDVYSTHEGADIFAEDMIQLEEESKIAAIFEDATIFLTGGTGFIGKLYMEKLLRTCPKLKKIYLLVRPKKGKDVQTRFQEMFDVPSMVPLKLSNSTFMNKLAIIHGDCTLPDLGLDEDSKKIIVQETNFVIHCAATVRFDEKIKTATHINVRAVRDLLTIAKQMKNLKAFLHVSTAYSNCPRKEIDEKFYDSVMPAEKLLDLVETLDEERLTNITQGLLGDWPNTYAFTKAIAEDVVKQEINHLPIAVLRPGIVIPTYNEPVRGWIDNLYGPTGVVLGAALGLIRSLHGDAKNRADLVPCDVVVNAGLAVIWDITNRRVENSIQDDTMNEDPIYNVVSSPEAPITWGKFTNLTRKHGLTVPTELMIWHSVFSIRANTYKHLIACFLLHTIPGYLVDFVCLCLGKERMMVKGYQKIEKLLNVVSYFVLREWNFRNDKIQKLWEKMDRKDRTEFNFSMKDFDWNNYMYFYVRGARVYLLKDPLDTIPKGRVKYWKLFVAHYALVAMLLYLFFKLMCLFWSCLF